MLSEDSHIDKIEDRMSYVNIDHSQTNIPPDKRDS